MQTAAVWRVNTDCVRRHAGEAGISCAFRAMAMNDIRLHACNRRGHRARRGDVAKSEIAPHRNAIGAERKMRCKLGKTTISILAAGQAVSNDSNLMRAGRLPMHQIHHVVEKPSHGRAEDVKNF